MSSPVNASALLPALIATGAHEGAMRALVEAGEAFHATNGAVLFRPGDVCAGYIAPTSGAVRVSLIAANGREALLYRVTPGDLCLQTFQCLVTGAVYASEGRAEGDLTGVLLRAGAFQTLMRDDAAFRDFLLQRVAARFGAMMRTLETMAFTPAPQRLAAALLQLGDADGAVEMTHAALAVEIGATREAVSRILEPWRDQGFVALARGRIVMTHRDALSRIAFPAA